ncbi:MAG: hypothetical protein SGI77_20990 [Pirellulaceae bacterium]|nr:hypothetical protein [Pirellulaceae bacterium]
MPSRFQWHARIKAVEREYYAMNVAARRMRDVEWVDLGQLPHDLRQRDLVNAAERLENTYLIRLYAEYEAGVREYWASIRNTQPMMKPLMESLTGRRGIPTEVHLAADFVREVRNACVHHAEHDSRNTLASHRSSLSHYFSFLPAEW